MSGLSQPERRGLERLQTPQSAPHPDPDLLAAFTEHSLSVRERDEVLGHLVKCSLCRETVALAGSPLVEPVPEPVQKRAWWELPLFRWGALAATAIVIVGAISVGTLTYRSPQSLALFNESPAALKTQSGDSVVSEAGSSTSAPANAEIETKLSTSQNPKRAVHLQEQVRYERPDNAAASKEQKATRGAVAGLMAKAVPAAPPPPPAAAGQDLPVVGRNQVSLSEISPSAAKDKQIDAKAKPDAAARTDQAGASKAAPAAPVPAQNETQATGYVAGVRDEAMDASQQSEAMLQMNSGVAAKTERAKTSVLAKKQPDLSETYGKNSAVNAYHQTGPIASRVTGTQWQITNLGQLQRAFDGGLWTNMLSDRAFRSVAVVRDHIWAGGDNGLLFYSVDNGRNWDQIAVRSGNTALTGNIVRMRFADDRNGTIETSTGETWATTDGGKSWQKQ